MGLRVCCVVTLGICTTSIGLAAAPVILAIPLPVDRTGSRAVAINDAGEVVVNAYNSLWTDVSSYRYDTTNGLVPLGTMGDGYDEARMINSAGTIVGYGPKAASGMEGFVWTADGMQSIGQWPGRSYCWANGINDNGVIVGGADGPTGATVPFRIAPGGNLTALPLPATATMGHAYAINDNNVVVGQASVPGRDVAYYYTPSAGAHVIPLGVVSGSAFSVNHSGAAVGQYFTGSTYHGFWYDPAIGVRQLGTLGGMSGAPYSIHDNGFIVGRSMDDWGAVTATMWVPQDDGFAALNLDAWLDQQNPIQGTRWALTDAYALNSSGWIVGEGFYTDELGRQGYRAFMLDGSALIPEPGALGLVAASALLLFRRR